MKPKAFLLSIWLLLLSTMLVSCADFWEWKSFFFEGEEEHTRVPAGEYVSADGEYVYSFAENDFTYAKRAPSGDTVCVLRGTYTITSEEKTKMIVFTVDAVDLQDNTHAHSLHPDAPAGLSYEEEKGNIRIDQTVYTRMEK